MRPRRPQHQRQADPEPEVAQAPEQRQVRRAVADHAAAHEPGAEQEHAQQRRAEEHQEAEHRPGIRNALGHGLHVAASAVRLTLALDQRGHLLRLRRHPLLERGRRLRILLRQSGEACHRPDQQQRQHVEHDAPFRQPRQRRAAEQQQQHQAQQCVSHQDVAGPDQQRVHQADPQQGQQAPRIQRGAAGAGRIRPLQHHRKAHPEQQRKQGDELALHQHVDGRIHPAVGAAETRVDPGDRFHQRPDERLDVHQQDAEQREPAQHVHHLDPLAHSDRRQFRLHVRHGSLLPSCVVAG